MLFDLSRTSGRARFAAFAIGHALLTRLTYAYGSVGANPLLRPDVGVAVGILAAAGLRWWPAATIGTLIGAYGHSHAIESAAIETIGATASVLAGSWMLRRVLGFRGAVETPAHALQFVAASIASGISSAILSHATFEIGVRSFSVVAPGAFREGAASALGVLLFTPAVFDVAAPRRRAPRTRAYVLEALALALVVAVTSATSFLSPPSSWQTPPFLAVALMAWGAMRFGPQAATAVSVVVAATAVAGATLGVGVFRHAHVQPQPWGLWSFLAVQACLSMLAAVTVRSRRRAERERESLLARLQLTLERMPAGCVVMDPDCRITSWNEAARRIFGFEANDVKGREPWGLITPTECADEVRTRVRRLADGQAEVSGVNENLTRDGRRILCEWTNTPLRGPRGEFLGVIAMCEDVTDRRRVETERDNLGRRLNEAQRLESLGVLAAGVAHDFNNLLTAILGRATLAVRDVPQDSPAFESLEEIRTHSLRAADLCRQLLAFAGRGPVEMRTVKLDAVVEDVVAVVRSSIQPKATVVMKLDRGLPSVRGDGKQLRQVIANLIFNAAESLDDAGGVVTVETNLVTVDAAFLSRTAVAEDLPEGEYLQLAVTDDGCGMTPEVCARIFEPFFTTKFPGRGLGLAAVLGIVRAHGGAVTVTSAPGKGSTFRVVLPKATGVDKPAAPPHVPAGRRPSGAVLVVDDDEAVLAAAVRMTNSVGYETFAASGATEAEALMKAHAPAITAALLDLTMPVMDGESLMRRLRAIKPDLPVVIMGGYGLDEVERRLRGAENVGFVQKPFSPADLSDRLRLASSAPTRDRTGAAEA